MSGESLVRFALMYRSIHRRSIAVEGSTPAKGVLRGFVIREIPVPEKKASFALAGALAEYRDRRSNPRIVIFKESSCGDR